MAVTDRGPDVARFVREQHSEIKRLFGDVQRLQGDERRDAFECLVRLLAVHETAEEEVIYPAVRASRPAGPEIAEARASEEAQAKSMLSVLERVGVDSDEFAPRFAVLRDAVIRHADSEEQTVLPLLEETQDRTRLQHMAEATRAAEALAPTHPHPHVPEGALANMAVGPMLAVIDRTRDALRHLER